MRCTTSNQLNPEKLNEFGIVDTAWWGMITVFHPTGRLQFLLPSIHELHIQLKA